MKNYSNTIVPKFATPDQYLRDLWHYARVIRDGSEADSPYATGSAWARLEIVRCAAKCIEWTDIPVGGCLHPDWERVADRLQTGSGSLAEIGQELVDLVDRECAAQGVDFSSHTDEP